MPSPPPLPAAPANSPAPLPPAQTVLRLQEIGRVLEQHFLDKQEIIRLLLITIMAGEHMVLIGPPGTAKSALLRMLARLIDARYFEYLLTRFTEPNELFGPIDIRAFREGVYRRRTELMLPEAELVFLDEIFKANSAILNSLLTLLNERRVHIGGQRLDVPLLSLLGASNEVPTDDSLGAVFDRFLLRVQSKNLDSFHFHRLIAVGLKNERLALGEAVSAAPAEAPRPLLSARDLLTVQKALLLKLQFGEEFLARYKGLIFQIRGEGIALSDRRVIKLLKLCAASALLEGREQADDSDLFILKHIWNSPDQGELLDGLVTPVLERYYREHPEQKRRLLTASLDDLLTELAHIRGLLSNAAQLSDIQLFAQLRSLGELRAALAAFHNDTSRRMLAEIDALLEGVFASGKFE